MLTYRLVNNLRLAEDYEWQELVLQNLGSEVHPSRKKGFCLAREALREALKSLGNTPSIAELQILKYNSISSYPQFTLSISHTTDWGAAVVAPKDLIVSVGIDIEPASRIVKPMIIERISNRRDAKLEPIFAWALKEAVFKALMNTGKFDRNEEFSSIVIGDNGWEHPSSGIRGEWKSEIQNEMIVALAWIKN